MVKRITELVSSFGSWRTALKGAVSSRKATANQLATDVQGHENDKSNPHEDTAAKIGAYTKDELNALVQAKKDEPVILDDLKAYGAPPAQRWATVPGYMNMLRNPQMYALGSATELSTSVSKPGGASTFDIVAWADVPSTIQATLPKRFVVGGFYPNAIHMIIDKPNANWWTPSCSISGAFTAGFGHVYIVSGSVSYFTKYADATGNYGSISQFIDRTESAWHIDATFGKDVNAEVWLFMPFFVAGWARSLDQVVWTWPNRGRYNGRLGFAD